MQKPGKKIKKREKKRGSKMNQDTEKIEEHEEDKLRIEGHIIEKPEENLEKPEENLEEKKDN